MSTTAIKWTYLIIDEDYSVTGTNDEKAAKEFAQSETATVVHVPTCMTVHVTASGQLEKLPIAEQKLYNL